MKTFGGQEAIRIVEQYRPPILCEYDGPDDHPSGINFGENVVIERPPLYYSVRGDGSRLYLLLCAYWYRDRHHRHDFSGALAVIENGEPLYLICRSHYNLVFTGADPWSVRVTAGSHSFEHGVPRPPYFPHDPKWVIDQSGDLNSASWAAQWKNVQRRFGEWVTLPDRWEDHGLNNYLRHFRSEFLRRFGTATTRGLMWSRPDVLVRIMEDRFWKMLGL